MENGVANKAPNLSVVKGEIQKREDNSWEPRSQNRGSNQSKATFDNVVHLVCTPSSRELKKKKKKDRGKINERRFVAQIVSLLFIVKKPMTLSYLCFLIGKWEKMTVNLRFLSKNSSLFVILPLDADFIIQLKHLPDSTVRLDAHLQRLGLPTLKVSLRERIGKLLNVLQKETQQRNVILDQIKSGPIPIEKLLKICHGSTDIAPVGVGFFLRHCEDFMVFKFYGVTYVSCRDIEHSILALDSESFGSLSQQKDEQFIIGRIKFILTHQLTSISIAELQYLRMGQVEVDGNLLIKHADVLVRSNFEFYRLLNPTSKMTHSVWYCLT